jgi:hypothetical protein
MEFQETGYGAGKRREDKGEQEVVAVSLLEKSEGNQQDHRISDKRGLVCLLVDSRL